MQASPSVSLHFSPKPRANARTQDVVYDLHELTKAGEIPSLPIFVDSPLATNVTEIFRQHPECYDEETNKLLMEDDDHDPFGFEMLEYVHSPADSKALNKLQESAIIISASGMCEGGRVLHHLRQRLGDPRTTVLFVGYQAEGTLGRKLTDGEKNVRVYGEEQEVHSRIEKIDGFSAHADEGELIDFIGAISPKPKKVFVVHGEPEAAVAMESALKRSGFKDVTIPARGQEFHL